MEVLVNLLFLGIGLVLLGLLPAVGLFLSFKRIRRTPEVSREYVAVPANERVIHIVRPQVESRYEYRLSGVVVVGDNKPDHTFDFYLLHDMATLALYEQGQAMPVKKYQFARRVIDWRTYMQTGPGLDFALVFVNPHPYELQITIQLDHYPTPALVRGGRGRVALVSVIVGLLISLVGVIMGIVGLIKWLF
jgi:hypothetical protein